MLEINYFKNFKKLNNPKKYSNDSSTLHYQEVNYLCNK